MTTTDAPAQLDPTRRTLMGPGPSDVPPRILQALAAPTLGHLDPEFLGYMDEIMALLRRVFATDNQLTFPISGTGSAGMEASLANVLEPGDRVVIGVNGVFGGRMVDVARRLGCEVAEVHAPWGEPIDPDELARAVQTAPTKLVGIVHAETSTGVRQPLEGLAEIAHGAGALLLADTVTSLGGIPVRVDDWGLDVAYAGTQKCLSCPPGLAPVTFSERAVDVIRRRSTRCASWYLDATMLLNYWAGDRAYHHTAPVNMLYALREALRMVTEEGLDRVHERHREHHRALVSGLQAMGLEMVVDADYRLPQLNTVRIPSGVDDGEVRRALLEEYNIEIGGGLGALKGEVWRVGLMGYSSRKSNVMLFLGALETVLAERGAPITQGRALQAAYG